MRFLFTVGLLLGFTCVAVQAQTHDAVAKASATDFQSGVERESFLLVNQYRKEHDLPALEWSDAIAKAARAHSKDMATGEVDFGHDGFRDRVNKLHTIMSGFNGAGENVFMSSDLNGVAKQAVTVWLHSPHHLENIRGDFNYSGMGVWQDKSGTIYFTQVFMKFKPEVEEATTAPAPAVVTPFGFLANPNTRAKP